MIIKCLNLIFLIFWQTSLILGGQSSNVASKDQSILQKALAECSSRDPKPQFNDGHKYYVYDRKSKKYYSVNHNWVKYSAKGYDLANIKQNTGNLEIQPDDYKPYYGNIVCNDITDSKTKCGPDSVCQNEFWVDACYGKNLETCILGTLNHCLTTEPGFLPKIRVNRPIETVTEIYLEKGEAVKDLPFKHTMCNQTYYYGLYGLLNIMGDPGQDVGCPFEALRNVTWDKDQVAKSIEQVRSSNEAKQDKDLTQEANQAKDQNAKFITDTLDGLLKSYYDSIINCLLAPIKNDSTGLVDRQIVFQEGYEKINEQYKLKPLFVCQNLAGQSIGSEHDFKSRTVLTTDDDAVGVFKDKDIVIAGNNACISAPDAKICVACNGAVISCPKATLNFTQGGQVKSDECQSSSGSTFDPGWDVSASSGFPQLPDTDDMNTKYIDDFSDACSNFQYCRYYDDDENECSKQKKCQYQVEQQACLNKNSSDK